jgi:DnaK suppressor protein
MNFQTRRVQLTDERGRLLASQQSLNAEQGTTIDGRRIVDVNDALPQDPAEIGEAASGRIELLTELGYVDDELAEVDAAIARIDSGTYGYCETCGLRIDDVRLIAIPTARRCAADQRRFESGTYGIQE